MWLILGGLGLLFVAAFVVLLAFVAVCVVVDWFVPAKKSSMTLMEKLEADIKRAEAKDNEAR